MGKKRERELEERLNAMIRERNDRDAARERTLVEALKSMSAEAFVIMTRAGHIVSARAIDANVSAESIRSDDGQGWPTYMAGPRECSAHIVITPIENGS